MPISMTSVKRRPNLLQLRRLARPTVVDRAASVYATKLGQHLNPLLALVKRHVLPLTDPNYKHDNIWIIDAPAEFDTIVREFGRFRLALFQQMRTGSTLDAWRAALSVDGKSKEEFRKLLVVDVTASEPWLRPLIEDWVAQNVSLVRSVGESTLSEMEQTILRMVRDGASRGDITKEIENVFGLSLNRAKLIARDQVSKFNGLLTEERQTRAGIDEYRWRDSADARVRPDHQRLDGNIYRWDSPPVTVTRGKRAGERNHPGGDIQCRCSAEPIIKDDLIQGVA